MTKMRSMGARPVSMPRMPPLPAAWSAKAIEDTEIGFIQCAARTTGRPAVKSSFALGNGKKPEGPVRQALPAGLHRRYGRRDSPCRSTYRAQYLAGDRP